MTYFWHKIVRQQKLKSSFSAEIELNCRVEEGVVTLLVVLAPSQESVTVRGSLVILLMLIVKIEGKML